MTCIETPGEYHGTEPSLFLAGGINSTHDWQLEFGGWSAEPKQVLFVGTDSNYQRRLDVQIQLKLARLEVALASDIPALADQVRAWAVGRSHL